MVETMVLLVIVIVCFKNMVNDNSYSLKPRIKDNS